VVGSISGGERRVVGLMGVNEVEDDRCGSVGEVLIAPTSPTKIVNEAERGGSTSESKGFVQAREDKSEKNLAVWVD
jgi:hypothetical protein